ncbi:MAG: hypothetical protein NTY02_01195, partial [Acidobacteria bacterium]|nr:hypothetical protein [Acidobacteriota bacterium]
MRTATRHIVHLENGWLGGTTRADVHELFRSFAAHPNSDCLVVHIHGGLVNEAAGVAIADRLAPAYIAAGGYPLFFVWESGPLEILVDVAADLGRDPVFRAVLQPTVTFARGKLEQTAAEVAVSAAAREPEIGELTAHGEPFAFEPDRLPPDAALTPGEEARFVAALERDAGVARARAAAP